MPALAKARALASVSPLRCHAFDASQYSSKVAGLRPLTSTNFAPEIRQQIPFEWSHRQFRFESSSRAQMSAPFALCRQPGEPSPFVREDRADLPGGNGASETCRSARTSRRPAGVLHVHWRSIDQRGCIACDRDHSAEKFTLPSQTHLFTSPPPSGPRR